MIYFAKMAEKVKILILRFSSIGDIVLCTPVIRCLKEQVHGDAELHFLTKKSYLPVLEHNPYLSKIHTIEKSTKEVIDQLRAEEFDYVIDLHHNLRTTRVKSGLKAMSFSFNKLNLQKWLLTALKINRLPNVHIVDRYLETVKALGIENDGKGLDYFLPPDQLKMRLSQPFDKDYIALVLSATHGTKRPLEKHFTQMVEGIDRAVILIGGEAEAELGDRLAKAHPEKCLNMAGKSTLHESAMLIKDARSVITPDTGMMHIATAFGKTVYSIWGNTVPEFGMYPYYAKGQGKASEIFEVKGLNCRPCSKIGYEKCPKGHFKCMEDQEWERIVGRVKST